MNYHAPERHLVMDGANVGVSADYVAERLTRANRPGRRPQVPHSPGDPSGEGSGDPYRGPIRGGQGPEKSLSSGQESRSKFQSGIVRCEGAWGLRVFGCAPASW